MPRPLLVAQEGGGQVINAFFGGHLDLVILILGAALDYPACAQSQARVESREGMVHWLTCESLVLVVACCQPWEYSRQR